MPFTRRRETGSVSLSEEKESGGEVSLQNAVEKNAGSFRVEGGGTDEPGWSYDPSANTLTFNAPGDYTVTGDGTETKEQIVVAGSFGTGSITIENVNINLFDDYSYGEGYKDLSAFKVEGGADLTLNLKGKNSLVAGTHLNRNLDPYDQLLLANGGAGIEVRGSLIIEGDGSLYAAGGINAAGIGSSGGLGANTYMGDITINSGNITAKGGGRGAGIGGGNDAWNSGDICIYGGTVHAEGGDEAAAKFGSVTYTYSDAEDGTYTEEAPVNAGTWYVKATVKEDKNYTGLETVKEFTISRAVPEYTLPENLQISEGETLSSLKLPEGFAWENPEQTAEQTGDLTFSAVYTPEDTVNYETVRLELTVSVVPAMTPEDPEKPEEDDPEKPEEEDPEKPEEEEPGKPEKEPIKPDQNSGKEEDQKQPDSGQTVQNAAETGDTFHPLFPAVLLAASVACLIRLLSLLAGKRNKKI